MIANSGDRDRDEIQVGITMGVASGVGADGPDFLGDGAVRGGHFEPGPSRRVTAALPHSDSNHEEFGTPAR